MRVFIESSTGSSGGPPWSSPTLVALRSSSEMSQMPPTVPISIWARTPSTDHYDRLPAYAELRGGPDPATAQLRGLDQGVRYGGRPFRRVAAFRRAQRSAREASRGVWGECDGDFHRFDGSESETPASAGASSDPVAARSSEESRSRYVREGALPREGCDRWDPRDSMCGRSTLGLRAGLRSSLKLMRRRPSRTSDGQHQK